MDNKYFETWFENLGIEIKPLPDNYNPDAYGLELMSRAEGNMSITYSANTIIPNEVVQQKQ